MFDEPVVAVDEFSLCDVGTWFVFIEDSVINIFKTFYSDLCLLKDSSIFRKKKINLFSSAPNVKVKVAGPFWSVVV